MFKQSQYCLHLIWLVTGHNHFCQAMLSWRIFLDIHKWLEFPWYQSWSFWWGQITMYNGWNCYIILSVLHGFYLIIIIIKWLASPKVSYQIVAWAVCSRCKRSYHTVANKERNDNFHILINPHSLYIDDNDCWVFEVHWHVFIVYMLRKVKLVTKLIISFLECHNECTCFFLLLES